MIGDFTYRHRDMLSDLLYLDTLRGKDSTGIVAVRGNRTIEEMKYSIPGYDFVNLKGFDDFLKLNDVIWMGHNRFKTVGDATRQNAHPFMVPDEEGFISIIGAHNGTIQNKHNIPDHNKFGTDSEAIFNYLAKEEVKTVIGKLFGAWALTWYDFRVNKFFMLRNKERPLCFAYSEDDRTFFWASESWMLRVAAERRGIKLKPIFFPNEDTLYSVELPDKGAPGKIPEPVVEGGVEGAKAQTHFPAKTPYKGSFGYESWLDDDDEPDTYVGSDDRGDYTWKKIGGGWIKEYDKSSGSSSDKAGGTAGGKEAKADEKDLNDDLPLSMVRGFEGEMIDKQLAKMLAEEGCGWCTGDIDFDGGETYAWLDMGEMVCKKCLRGEHADPKEEEKSNVVHLIPPVNNVLSSRQQKALETFRESVDRGGMSIK